MTARDADRFRSLRPSTGMGNMIRSTLRAIVVLATVSALGLAVHYFVRLHLIAHSTVMIEPGEWMWVECGTRRFVATIEDVSMTGIVVHTGAGRPTGMPCEAAGVTARGNRAYFMPFRTVLSLAVDERTVWSNPFSM